MTDFEIAVSLALIVYGIIFGIICAELFSRIRRNKSGIEITNNILNHHGERIDRINNRIDFKIQTISDMLEKIRNEVPEMEIKYKKCKFTAILNNCSEQIVLVKAPCDAPDDYIWHLAIKECKNFEFPLQELHWNGVDIVSEEPI